MSKYCLFQMFIGQWEKSEKYNNFMVPMVKVENAINAKDSGEWFFEYLNSRFSRDVFMAAESMKEQLNLIGIGFVDWICLQNVSILTKSQAVRESRL